jgi:hypothetical protein
MTGRHLVVDMYRDRNDCVVFELKLDEQLLLATENPATISAAIFVMDVRSVKFSYARHSGNLTYSAVPPFDDADLSGMRAIANGEKDLVALMAIIYACHVLLEYAMGIERVPLGAVANHWHAAAVLMPQDLVIKRPNFKPPADWDDWMNRQKKFMRYCQVKGGRQEGISQD